LRHRRAPGQSVGADWLATLDRQLMYRSAFVIEFMAIAYETDARRRRLADFRFWHDSVIPTLRGYFSFLEASGRTDGTVELARSTPSGHLTGHSKSASLNP
jgi:hypothetical protein